MSGLSYEEFIELNDAFERGEAKACDLERLEPYRARRAVMLASGAGTRLRPITINTPKPMVNVNGRRIISTLLDALAAIGVEEVIVVTGYLKEEFELLKRDYPYVSLVENPLYETTNNISSVCCALAANPFSFQNAYVFESDLLLNNPGILKKYQYESCYWGVKVDETPDWCFDTEDGYISDLHKGGKDCYHMFGISYWTAEDGKKIANDVPGVFEDAVHHQRFWDDVPCVLKKKKYRIRLNECSFDDVAEIDTVAELRAIDPRYKL